MESTAQNGGLEDVSVITPILQKIIADRSVINVVRARLQRLLDAQVTKLSNKLFLKVF